MYETGKLSVVKHLKASMFVLVKTSQATEKKWLQLYLAFLQEDSYGHNERWLVGLAGRN